MNDLSEAEIHALNEALDDEYRAWATYDQVIADFGDVRPFTNIRAAEARHIQALCSLFGHYRLPVPGNPWNLETVTRYASLQEACEAGVVAEIANGEMYDRLLKVIRVLSATLQTPRNRAHAARARGQSSFWRMLGRARRAAGPCRSATQSGAASASAWGSASV
ncbi:DUF2202 domain-containing protein [Candidatus Accumulibacter sp. ACC005]|uniref:ferritin-like domain-containing protein n=1 Tax=Candidatus Accumulibacter sp. ACC005 TaxID=2823331 RepID=UPI0025BF104B|nr:DUF2202 domain-containing protein [Candidatus Accumulibacter sp. ACC005]